MARERYDPWDNQWIEHPEADWQAFVENVEAEVGEPVPLTMTPAGYIIIDFDAISASENTVKQAVRDHHPHR